MGQKLIKLSLSNRFQVSTKPQRRNCSGVAGIIPRPVGWDSGPDRKLSETTIPRVAPPVPARVIIPTPLADVNERTEGVNFDYLRRLLRSSGP